MRRLAAVLLVAVEAFVGGVLPRRGRRLVVRILLPELLLRRGDQAEVMLGVLEVVLGGDRIAGALGVTGELQIFLGDVMRGAADFHLRPVRLVDPGQRIVMMTAPATAAAPL